MAEFRWKRGLLHALIPFAGVIAMGLIVLFVQDPKDPEKFGEGLGRFAMVSLLAGLGSSYLFQTGKRKAGAIVAALIGAAIVGLTAMLLLIEPRPKIDRRPLVDDGKTLRHPSLHFSIKRPPAEFKDAPQLVELMGNKADKDTVSYAYAPSPPTTGLVISVIWGASDMAETTQGIKAGLQKSGATLKSEQVGSEDAHLVGLAKGVTLTVDAHLVDHTVVTTTVLSSDPNALADVISSFQR